MNNNIEQLKTEVDDIKNSLNALKNNVSVSEVEKKNQAETLKNKAEETRQKIQKEIDLLGSKTDDESKKRKDEAEILLNSFSEITSLYTFIINSSNNTSTSINQPKIVNNKAKNNDVFGKARDWVGKQWDDVWNKDKWTLDKEGGKNLLRTAGFVASGVGALALVGQGAKKLLNGVFGYNDEVKKSSRTESRWERGLLMLFRHLDKKSK